MTSLDSSKLPYVKELLSWTGIGWIVALIVGVWGVLLGLGEFRYAEYISLLCGAVVLPKVAVDNLHNYTKRSIAVLVLAVAGIVVVELLVMEWTNTLKQDAAGKEARLAQLDEIPQLTTQLREMTKANAVAAQKLADIGSQNTDLKKSIEQKDAVLASIAKAQYDLNFVPSVQVEYENGHLNVVNMGKENIYLWGSKEAFDKPNMQAAGRLVSPQSSYSIEIDGSTLVELSKRINGGKLEIRQPYYLYITSENGKKYTLSFLLFLGVKDGVFYVRPQNVGQKEGGWPKKEDIGQQEPPLPKP